MNESIKALLRPLAIFNRHLRFARYKKRPGFQKDITLICNNCTAGTMYNTFKLQFMSPTINLYFETLNDFYSYYLHLSDYTKNGTLKQIAKLEIKKGFSPNAPIGKLSAPNCPDITIHFLHYKNWPEAEESWERRTKRINLNKIFVVCECRTTDGTEIMEKLASLPYDKVIFTDGQENENRGIIHMPFYDKFPSSDSYPLLKLINMNGKRGYDDYDFANKIFMKKNDK